MAGRWAQLAVDAHIAHAIDYSRPVKPTIEYIIHRALVKKRKLAVAALYPVVNEDGEELFLTKESLKDIKETCLFPWEALETAKVDPKEQLLNQINLLKQIQAANNDG